LETPKNALKRGFARSDGSIANKQASVVMIPAINQNKGIRTPIDLDVFSV
jgi:hypothetical protein